MNSTLEGCTTTSAHVDWVTCTARERDTQEALWSLGNRLLDGRKLEGEEPSRWHAHGYGGWSATGVRVAARPDSAMLQLSGRKSADHWKEAVAAADNTSRIDVAVDSEFEPPVSALLVQLYRKMGRHQRASGRTPKRTLWTCSDGGATLYIGARVSEHFGRIYDKGVETGSAPPGSWWRWELELKGETGRSNASELLSINAGCSELASAAAGWFRARVGTAPPSFTSAFVHNVPSDPPDSDRTLRWLASGVRPSVQRLLKTVPRQRILEALGLSTSAPNRAPIDPETH